MAFVYEWQFHCSCDTPDCHEWDCTSSMGRDAYLSKLRGQGWKISPKGVICPKCANDARKGKVDASDEQSICGKQGPT